MRAVQSDGLGERPHVLDLFLLAAFANAGMETSYDLQRVLGVSNGAIMPSLGRLESGGYLRRAPAEDRRGKRRFEATRTGEKALYEALHREALHQGEESDWETLVRTIWISVTMLGQPAARELSRAAETRRKMADAQKSAAEHFQVRLDEPAALYRWLRAVFQCVHLEAEAKAIEDMRQQLFTSTT